MCHFDASPAVEFDRERLVIMIHKPYPYEIDLETCTGSAQVLDWIFQVFKKTWSTPELIYEILEGIEQACEQSHGDSAQGVFCPGGRNRAVSWGACR